MNRIKNETLDLARRPSLPLLDTFAGQLALEASKATLRGESPTYDLLDLASIAPGTIGPAEDGSMKFIRTITHRKGAVYVSAGTRHASNNVYPAEPGTMLFLSRQGGTQASVVELRENPAADGGGVLCVKIDLEHMKDGPRIAGVHPEVLRGNETVGFDISGDGGNGTDFIKVVPPNAPTTESLAGAVFVKGDLIEPSQIEEIGFVANAYRAASAVLAAAN
jgi:hypothetical protein